MSKTPKYYVVWRGYKVGIFRTWAECQTQVQNYPFAQYKSYATLAEAEVAFKQGYEQAVKIPKQNLKKQLLLPPKQRLAAHPTPPIWESIAVDAACNGNPGDLEYRGVITATGEEIFKQGIFEEGTNNIGEFLAIVHGLAFLHKQQSNWAIYTDSLTALSWVRNQKMKTQLTPTDKNKPLFDLIERAWQWLNTYTYTNQLLHWQTEAWGEIPADFGRK